MSVRPSIEYSIPYPTRVPVRRTFDTVSDTKCLSVEYSISYLTPCVCPSTLDSVSDSVCLSVKHSKFDFRFSIPYLTRCVCPSTLDSVSEALCLSFKAFRVSKGNHDKRGRPDGRWTMDNNMVILLVIRGPPNREANSTGIIIIRGHRGCPY